jgi:hypothetical protein
VTGCDLTDDVNFENLPSAPSLLSCLPSLSLHIFIFVADYALPSLWRLLSMLTPDLFDPATVLKYASINFAFHLLHVQF